MAHCDLASQLSLSNPSLTYGEIDFNSYALLLEMVDIQSGQTFADLGHGVGKSLIATALVAGSVLKEIHGVEIIPELYIISKAVNQAYSSLVSSSSTSPHWLLSKTHSHFKVSVSLGDFLTDSRADGEFYDWTIAGKHHLNTLTLNIPTYLLAYILCTIIV